jgi:hypothetical protein
MRVVFIRSGVILAFVVLATFSCATFVDCSFIKKFFKKMVFFHIPLKIPMIIGLTTHHPV